MKVLILGGDGYLGWPTAMHLAQKGHQVQCVDNYLRRRAHADAGSDSLTPILESLPARTQAFHEITGLDIGVSEGDLCDYAFTEEVFRKYGPDAVIHYGEIPSAPYSMKNREQAVFTQVNNVVGTMNVLWAIREFAPEAHLVKLGTMGEYGTPNIDIEEGFIEIHHNGRSDRLPYPKVPGSIYHLSKVHDSHNIHFACRVWGLRSTDLNQGVVYGIHTPDTKLDERLATRFDYDETFGTALNRFCVQAIIGHPLTVYGAGGQTRGYLNIVDTLQCVELAMVNAPQQGEYRVFNQFTEQFSVLELARLVQGAGKEWGIEVKLQHLENPRVEKEEHYYNGKHTKLLDLGLQPHLLSPTLIENMFASIQKNRHRIKEDKILPRTRWTPLPVKSAALP